MGVRACGESLFLCVVWKACRGRPRSCTKQNCRGATTERPSMHSLCRENNVTSVLDADDIKSALERWMPHFRKLKDGLTIVPPPPHFVRSSFFFFLIDEPQIGSVDVFFCVCVCVRVCVFPRVSAGYMCSHRQRGYRIS